jgi:hypothetical protein
MRKIFPGCCAPAAEQSAKSMALNERYTKFLFMDSFSYCCLLYAYVRLGLNDCPSRLGPRQWWDYCPIPKSRSGSKFH